MNDTDNWDAFGSKYIKADNVANNTDEYAITDVTSQDEADKKTLILTIQRNGIEKLFGCNATNEQAVKAVCPDSPKQAIGKVITFNKVKTMNPNTKKEVDGLRLQFKVTEPKEESGIQEDSTM